MYNYFLTRHLSASANRSQTIFTTRAYYTLPNYLAPSVIRWRVYRHEILNEARHPRHRGEYGALPTGVSAGEDREPERVRTGQPGSQRGTRP